MTNKDSFSARLDRIKAQAQPDGTHSAPSETPRKHSPRPKAPLIGPMQMISVGVSLCILIVGIFALSGSFSGDGAGPFDLKAAIMRNMSEEKRATLGKNPAIERELQKRKFADPDLARLILSH